MLRKFWSSAFAFLLMLSLASVVDAQVRKANSNRKAPPAHGQDGIPGISGHGDDTGNGNQGDNPNPDSPRRTPDGTNPAEEDVCDELKYYTPGLYGLCIAFCEAHDCEPDFTREDGDYFANCKKNDWKILEKYNRKKKEGDPEMPCLPVQNEEPGEVTCPCWSEDELWAMPGWDAGCEEFGLNQGDNCVQSVYNVFDIGEYENAAEELTWVQFYLTTATDDGCFAGNTCSYYFECDGPDCPDARWGFFQPDVEISEAEFLVCEQQLQQLQSAMGLSECY